MQPIPLSKDQLGESGSSDDEEPIAIQPENITTTLPLPIIPEKTIPETIKVKEVMEEVYQDSTPDIRPIEGPKIDPSMLKVMGVKEEQKKVERDGQVPTIYDIDIDQLEDKPWRKPDADITDWFNYGFTEETWREYCKAQVRMRLHLYPHGKKSTIISKPVPKERGSLNMKPVTQRPKPQPQKSFMKPNQQSSRKRDTHRERERDNHPPQPVWQNPPRNHNPSTRNPPPLPNKLPVAPVPQLANLLPDLASFANQLPAGMPKLPPVIEKLLAGTSGTKDEDEGRSRRRRSRSRERRRRRRRSRSPRGRRRRED